MALNRNLRVKKEPVFRTKHLMAVQLKISEIQIFFVAAYFPPLTEVEEIISDITDPKTNGVMSYVAATSTVSWMLMTVEVIS